MLAAARKGSSGAKEQYYATSRDYVVIDTLLADVTSITKTFNSDYAQHNISSVTPSGHVIFSPGSETPLVSLIRSATHSVWFESEELKDAYIIDALASDAARGVSCHVVMTKDYSYYSGFSTLKKAGCVVRLYPNTTTGLYIHAKAIIVDANTQRARVFVGSQNASISSLVYNRELGIIVSVPTAPPVVSAISGTFARDFAAAPLTW